MSKTFTSMDALKTAIQKEIKDAMTEVADQSLLNVHQNVDSFYAFGGGGQYQRTGQLAESPEVRLSGDGDNYNLQISLDTGFRYNPYGNMVINGRTIEEYVNDMANMQSIAVPDFSDVTASVVSQLESKGMGNVMVEYNQPVTFNSVDKNDIPQMEEFLKRAREDTTKYIVKELRNGGMQIRR